jgi:hypothetical protein
MVFLLFWKQLDFAVYMQKAIGYSAVLCISADVSRRGSPFRMAEDEVLLILPTVGVSSASQSIVWSTGEKIPFEYGLFPVNSIVFGISVIEKANVPKIAITRIETTVG